MSSTRIHKVEGYSMIESVNDRRVPVHFKVERTGSITLEFDDPRLAQAIIAEAMQNRLVGLGVYYTHAPEKLDEPAEEPELRSPWETTTKCPGGEHNLYVDPSNHRTICVTVGCPNNTVKGH